MEFPLFEADVWQVYQQQGGLVLGLGDEEIDKVIAWRETTGATFPLLLMQSSYDAYGDFPGSVYALDILADKQGLIRYGEHGIEAAKVADWFEVLLAED